MEICSYVWGIELPLLLFARYIVSKHSILQALSEDLGLGCDSHHLCNVECRNSESFGEAEFAIGLGRGIIRRSESHVFAIKTLHTLHAFHAGSTESHFLYDNCSFWVDLVVTHRASPLVQSTFHFFFLQSFAFFLSKIEIG